MSGGPNFVYQYQRAAMQIFLDYTKHFVTIRLAADENGSLSAH